MKIAICFYGSTGNLSSFRKNTVKAKSIDISIPARHYKKFIIDKNPNCEFDIFCHSSSKGNQQRLTELYNPKYISVEKNPFGIANEHDEFMVRDYANKSRWYSTWRVNKFREDYEKDNNKWYQLNKLKYDYVFMTRYDVVFFEGFRFDELDPEVFYTQGVKYAEIGPEWEKAGRILDWWFVATPDKMSLFCDAYEHYDEMRKENIRLQLPSYDQHCFVHQQFQKYGFKKGQLLNRCDDNVLCRFIQSKRHDRTKKDEWIYDTTTQLYRRK